MSEPVLALGFALGFCALGGLVVVDMRRRRDRGGPEEDGETWGRVGREDHPSPKPGGGGESFDWDAFTDEFWEHVERESERVAVH